MKGFKHNLYFSEKDLTIKGFQEIVFSVSDLDKWIDFFQNICEWKLVSREVGTDTLKSLWSLDNTVDIEEALLVNLEDNSGHLRLVKFKNIAQKQIRSGANLWDTGGIFDINIRVKDMDEMFSKFQLQGWNGYTDPIRFKFDKFDVTEVLLKGPDGITFAIMERHNPPLEGFIFEKASRIFNSTITCINYETTRDFFIKGLGFKIYYETDGKNRSFGANVIGIPPSINSDIVVPVCVLHPNGENNGSIELMETKNLKGKDCAQFAKPPNLGILMYRFPVRNADTYAKTLIERGLTLSSEVQTINVLPYGNLKIFSILSPDGVWIEFIELID